MAGSNSSQHYRHGNNRGSTSSVSSSGFSTSGLFRTNGRLASVGSTVGEKIPSYIPGFKTSATFLSSLSANLRLPDDALLPSPAPSPFLRALDPPYLPPMPIHELDPSPALLTPASTPDLLDGIPSLSTFVASSRDDRVAALKLVADSVAQQRQVAGRAVLAHPVTLAVAVAVLAMVAKIAWRGPGSGAVVFTSVVGVAMALLVGVRWMVGGYVSQAEDVGLEWLGDDMVVVTKYGDVLIGALVLGWEGERRRKKKGGKGVVRAWTVLLKYRGKGEGKALLEEAVRLVQKKGGEGLEFEEGNVYSRRVLPTMYNKVFDVRDNKAYDALDDIVRELGGFKRR